MQTKALQFPLGHITSYTKSGLVSLTDNLVKRAAMSQLITVVQSIMNWSK